VNTYTTGDQRTSPDSVSVGASGEFRVAWTSSDGVRLRRFDEAGLPVGSEEVVALGDGSGSVLTASLTSNRFALAAETTDGLEMVVYDQDGSTHGSPLSVSAGCSPRMASAGGTTLMVVSESCNGPGIRGQRLKFEFTCNSVPRPNCWRAGVARIGIERGADDSRDKLTWKWAKGEATAQADLGDPTSATDYRLCVYDAAGGVTSLETGLRVPAGAAWRDKAPKGFTYRDSAMTSDGVRSVSLRTGIDTKAKVTFSAKGANIPMPVPFNEFLYFVEDPAVTVQLVNSEGECWTSEFTPDDTSKNDSARFRAKAR